MPENENKFLSTINDIYASMSVEASRFINSFSSTEEFVSYWEGIGDSISTQFDSAVNSISEWLGKASDQLSEIGEDAKNFLMQTGNNMQVLINEITEEIISSTNSNGDSYELTGDSGISNPDNESDFTNSMLNAADTTFEGIENFISGLFEDANAITSTVSDALQDFADTFGSQNSYILKTIGKITEGLSNIASDYQDGISETSFGAQQEESWQGTRNSFLETFKRTTDQYKIKFSNSTPLDAGSNSQNLYGSMLLGTPPTFTNITDPANRTYIQTFLQDAKFLTLTPGLPKYNGTSYDTGRSVNQASDGNAMMEYLLRNGLDESFANKDKRYYSFQPKYEEYFSYLETMLNTIRIKMGLATGDNNEYNLFTFFKLKNRNNRIDSSGFNQLLAQYQNSIGFFINPSGTLAESIDSSQTGFGSELASSVNSASDTFQKTNYITGMGTGGFAKNVIRVAGNAVNSGILIRNLVADNLQTASSWQRSRGDKAGIIGSIAGFAAGLAIDVGRFAVNNDFGAAIQMVQTTNGMKVTYPELWAESQYTRSVNINFEFISPYGDPLSIFKYVMVPFCALMCFAMPRQAAENGLVSPFLVRGDVSGMFTVDLGMITSFTFTRGGSNDLRTKDGLPLAISGSFTIQDLYPFMAMSKRLSFMSANPNYTVFLNSLAGLHSVYDSDDTALNEYFREMLNRVSGKNNVSNKGLWNKFNSANRSINNIFANTAPAEKMSLSGSRVPRFRNANS